MEITLPVSKRIALKNILFLTDFSEASGTALPYATTMARAYDSNVTALHVVVPSVYTYMAGQMSASVLDAEDDAAKTKWEGFKLSSPGFRTKRSSEEAQLLAIVHEVLARAGSRLDRSRDSRTHRIEESDVRFNCRGSVPPDDCPGAHGWTGRAEACPQRRTISVRAFCYRFQFRFERRGFICDVSGTGKPIQTGSSARAANAEIGKKQQTRRPLGS